MITKKNILIAGSRAPMALDLARSLKRNRYDVFFADSVKQSLCRFSSHCADTFHVASSQQFNGDL